MKQKEIHFFGFMLCICMLPLTGGILEEGEVRRGRHPNG